MRGRSANGSGSISRRKDGRYEAAVYLITTSGVRKRIRAYAATQVEARTKLVDLMARADQGIPIPDRRVKVGEYLDYWMANVAPAKLRPRTLELYEMAVRVYLKPGLGKQWLSQLSVPQVQLLLGNLLAEGKNVSTVRMVRTVLSSALTRANREELLTRNVARLVELPSWERKDVDVWTPEQVARFLAAAENHRLYPAFLLLTTYGLRRGEALGLRWGDIDFDREEIHIRQQLQRLGGQLTSCDVKTRAGRRTLPLLPKVREVLRTHRELQQIELTRLGLTNEADVVSTSTAGTPVDPKNLARAFQLIRRQADLPPFTVHYLRHTAATMLKNYGVPARDTQLILGHAHVSTTQQIYQHGDVLIQREGLEGVQRLVMNGRDSVYCRQLEPQGRDLVALFTSMLSGGPSGTRTHDTLLKSDAFLTTKHRLTEVNQYERARRRLRLIGCAAVILAAEAGGP